MDELKYNRLLVRQMRRFIPLDRIDELEEFLQSISEFYDSAEQERKLLEHTLDVNSKELEALNRSIKQQYEELREQEALRNARDEAILEKEVAIAANRAKDVFLANMSHELRTPLNAINGFSQILLHKNDIPESAKKYIEKIYISGNNLLSLVNTILDFTKIEAGKMDFNLTSFPVDILIDEASMLVEVMLREKKISLHRKITKGAQITADRQLLKQVIINLLSNAVKFSPEDERILVMCREEEKRYVFAVVDHGYGISNDKIDSLFNPFVQIREHQNSSIKGTGLGLSIVKKIIEMHGGTVWVESVEGKGSSFYFSIPKVEDQ